MEMKNKLIEESTDLGSEELMLMGWSRSESEIFRLNEDSKHDYDISKRVEILSEVTLKEIIEGLNDILVKNGDKKVLFCGQKGCFIHISEDYVNIDISDLRGFYNYK